MNFRYGGPLAALLGLGACTDLQTGGIGGAGAVPMGDVPEAVAAMAAPNQNLQTARVLPEDGCYWYSHSGPVETTLLPLRTANGNPICTQPTPEA